MDKEEKGAPLSSWEMGEGHIQVEAGRLRSCWTQLGSAVPPCAQYLGSFFLLHHLICRQCAHVEFPPLGLVIHEVYTAYRVWVEGQRTSKLCSIIHKLKPVMHLHLRTQTQRHACEAEQSLQSLMADRGRTKVISHPH